MDVTYSAGQWNRIRFKLTPEKGEVWMNEVKYYAFVKASADWEARVAKSKFRGMPQFGKLSRGHLCLQDHGDAVAFPKIKIRPL